VSLATSHRRYNPLLDEWVLCSPHRLDRPWQGRTEAVPSAGGIRYDPACYLCPGNVRASGERNPPYESTFAFDNDFSALSRDSAPVSLDQGRLLRARSETGVCRVICFSSRHDLSLARMETPAIRRVVDAWAEEVERLSSRADIRHVQVFENKGALMGCSNPHPHGQVWATQSLPTVPQRKLQTQRAYHEAHGIDLLGDYLREEEGLGERLVIANQHWVVLVPFWAVWPFETLVLPRERVPDLPSLDASQRDALADVVRRLGLCYDTLFGSPFPYSMGWHGRPADGEEHRSVRLHAFYLPPLLRSATVKKFLVGYELAAEPQRDLTPEDAASRLRAAAEASLAPERADP
jgi:UDPglucose--hexose-1-phosphate uridylyltransferase